MDKQKAGLELLNAASSVGLIALIHEHKEVTVSELRELTGGYDRLKRVAADLEEAGLLKKRTVEKPYLTYIYTLTEKGKKLPKSWWRSRR